jgi:hypothetical protein
MSARTLNSLLLIVILLCVASALATLIPHMPAAGAMVSDLGYYTFCPFAPYSTLTLLFVAGAVWAVRRHLQTQLNH